MGLFTFMYFLGDFLNYAKYGRLVLTASLVLLQLLLLPCGYLDSTSHTGMPELQCKTSSSMHSTQNSSVTAGL